MGNYKKIAESTDVERHRVEIQISNSLFCHVLGPCFHLLDAILALDAEAEILEVWWRSRNATLFLLPGENGFYLSGRLPWLLFTPITSPLAHLLLVTPFRGCICCLFWFRSLSR